jgi:hypothetical protein
LFIVGRAVVPAEQDLHTTVADALPNTDYPGGHWLVACTCGWERSGKYTRATGEPVALRLAQVLGTQHEQQHNKETQNVQ